MKPIGLLKRGGRVPKSFFFEKPNKTMSFFDVFFKALCSNTLVKFFLFCVMQTFLSSKMTGNSLEEKLCS